MEVVTQSHHCLINVLPVQIRAVWGLDQVTQVALWYQGGRWARPVQSGGGGGVAL